MALDSDLTNAAFLFSCEARNSGVTGQQEATFNHQTSPSLSILLVAQFKLYDLLFCALKSALPLLIFHRSIVVNSRPRAQGEKVEGHTAVCWLVYSTKGETCDLPRPFIAHRIRVILFRAHFKYSRTKLTAN